MFGIIVDKYIKIFAFSFWRKSQSEPTFAEARQSRAGSAHPKLKAKEGA
jgi:hypothetical protein